MLDTEESIDQEQSARRAFETMTKLTEDYQKGELNDETEEEPVKSEEPDETKGNEETPDEPVEASEEEPAATSPAEDQNEPETPPSSEETPPVEPTKDEKEPEDEVLAKIRSIKLRPNPHHKTAKAFKTVKEIAEEERKARLTAEKEIKIRESEIERQKQLKLLDEPTEKELNELRSFRRTFDIEHDPAFTQKYEEGQKTLETQALGVLGKYAPQSTVDFIKGEGGVLRFRSSQKQILNAQGEPIAAATREDGTAMTCQEFWEQKILGNLPPDDKDALSDIAIESRRLNREKEQELANTRKNAEKIFKDREEQNQARAKDWGERLKAGAEKTLQELGEVAVLKEVPNNATLEQKKAIEKHNATYERAKGIAQRLASDITPENQARMAIITAHYETAFKDQMKTKDEEIAALKAENAKQAEWIDKAKNAGKTSGKGPTGVPPKKEVPNLPTNPEDMMRQQTADYLKEKGLA